MTTAIDTRPAALRSGKLHAVPLKDELQDEKLHAVTGGSLANMRYEMLKTVANNLRA
ncbi:MAG TPA: hypothetical protein VH678_29685 [Xanthobacteraceae bacterium]|jgi:hypothetical protein